MNESNLIRRDEVSKMTMFERFCYFIKERESIRLKRLAGEEPPWTDDWILQTYRFTNVRRMDDKVSQWLLKNWYEPNFDHPNMLVAVCIARFINKIETLDHLGFVKNFKPSVLKLRLRGYRDKGNTVFGAAYIVGGMEGADKISSVVDYFLKDVVALKFVSTSLMELAHQSLSNCYGLGSFMSGQVVADLRWAVTGNWRDRLCWAPMGPGSKRGMNRLHERQINYNLKQPEFETELLELRDNAVNNLPESITSRMEAIDWQNCCCEFDKMIRRLNGEGRPKQLYKVSK